MKLYTQIKFLKAIKKFLDTVLPYSFQDIFQKIFFGGTYLSQVEFHIVDNCNLNCAHCDHFTPLAPENIIKIDKILDDFKTLKKVFDKIGKIYILGGEPLLHPNLVDIFEPLRKIYPESEIIIITNGILLSSQSDSFWTALKKYNIALSMTHYPINVDYEAFISKCSEYGIKSYYFRLDVNKMQKMDLDISGSRNKEQAFLKCSRKDCHFLKDKKLYVCSPVPNIHFLNNHFNLDFKVSKNDYIDLTKTKSASKITALFNRPIDFCKYCNDKDLSFDTYRVSKKELNEWVKDS